MRAISTRIKEETGVGRLILPNDHVDVILTMRRRGDHVSDTLFRNVRVLAIGQLIEAREGKKLAEGNTATLELTPSQAEELAAANAKGEISLVLRSIADIKGGDETGQYPSEDHALRRKVACAWRRQLSLRASQLAGQEGCQTCEFFREGSRGRLCLR